MKSIRINQQGSIGVILISIVTAVIVGALGYLYWDNFMKPQDNSNRQVAAKNGDKPKEDTKDPNEGYLVIEEWDIRAPYTGGDLSYSIKNEIATFVSKKLASKYDGCKTYGAGQVKRLNPDDGAYADGTGPKVKDFAKDRSDMYTQVGDYYYQFMHDAGVCNFKEGSGKEQNEANDVVKALVTKFESISE